MSIKDFKISAVDSSKGLSIGEYKDAAAEKNVESRRQVWDVA